MDFGWYLRRLRRMSIAEIAWRARTALLQQAWRFITPRTPAVGSITWNGAKLSPAEPIDPIAQQPSPELRRRHPGRALAGLRP